MLTQIQVQLCRFKFVPQAYLISRAATRNEPHRSRDLVTVLTGK